MYLNRDIDGVLREWSVSTARKPLILRGARQMGKTESIRQLSARFELFLELNLERYEDLALVRASQSAEDLLVALRARSNVASFKSSARDGIQTVLEFTKKTMEELHRPQSRKKGDRSGQVPFFQL